MKNGVLEMFRDAFVRLLAFVAVCALVVACTSSNGDGFAGGSSDDAGIYAIKDLDVAGVSQKGPFVKGSAVTVQGIDCQTMELTGEIFEGTVKSDKGDFGVDDVNLSATCALFEVTGYYFNEVTGKKSANEVTLHALSDLSDRKHVNINMLTELEYKRVMNLVSVEKMSFADAKKLAEKEVLASFNVNGVYALSEDLNIFENGDGNAALLAVSVLVQANANEAKLAERLDKYSVAISQNGSLDDKEKTEIANWATNATATGKLDTIRKNIESWNLTDSVPAFETYVKALADGDSVILSSESRSSSSNVIASEANQSSSSSVIPASSGNLLSSSSSSSRHSGLDPESSSSSSVIASEAKQSSSSVTNSYLNPNINYGEMTDSRDGQVYKTVKIGSQVWMAQNLNYETKNSYCYNDSTTYCEKYGRLYTWAAAMDSVKIGCGNGLVCSPAYPVQGVCPDGWHLPDTTEWNEMLVIAGGGYITLAGEALKSQGGWPSNENTTDALGFSAVPVGYKNYEGVFKNMNKYVDFWSSTDIEDGYAYVLMLRSEYDEAHLEYGGKDDAVAVRCVRNEPVASSISLLCSEERESCETFDWSISKEKYLNSNIEYGSFVDSRDGQVYKTVKISNQVWMAQNLNYADSVKTPSLKGRSWCYGDQSEKCKVAGRLYTWSAAIDSVQLATRDCGYGHECAIPSVVQGICPEGWHLPNKSELFTLSATAESNGSGGSALKSQIGWYNNSRNTDTYGFSAIPVGYRSHTGKYLEAGGYMHFWADDEEDAESSYATSLTYTLNSIRILYSNNKNDGLSVRCIKN